MGFLNKMERRFGRYAIPELMRYFTVFYAFGFVIGIWNPAFYFQYLALDPGQILRGQIWRLVTFLAYPQWNNLLFGLIMIWMYYSLGITLERTWGTFRFNVFMFTGVLFHIIAAFVIYFGFGYTGFSWLLSPDNLNLSILLAFAMTFPDMKFYLYFVLPVKAKYMGIVYAVIELYYFLRGTPAMKVTIFLCMLNVILFWILTGGLRKLRFRNLKNAGQRVVNEVKWKEANRTERQRAEKGNGETKIVPDSRTGTRHRCAVCGRTEKDGDDLVFRYCTKCKGDLEYCQDHLYTHVHVT
jgi:hypothetical protein